jgi:hypothetical protein
MKPNLIALTGLLIILYLLTAGISLSWAKPTTSGQAAAVVQAWRQKDKKPLKSTIGESTRTIQTFRDASGTDIYHVVNLDPQGFAIVPADDLIEPIIAFSSDGTFDPSDTNPLGALISRDLPNRIAHVRGALPNASFKNSGTSSSEQTASKRKWDHLQGITPVLDYGVVSLSDVRVAPFIQSKWNQSTVNGNLCYNRYTPSNYVSGCVATAMSQLMRYHQFPSSSIGTASFPISVAGGTPFNVQLMGGNGSGSAYDWSQMPLVPDTSTGIPQFEAIGRLLHDTGAVVNMDYSATGSGADTFQTADGLKTTYGYSNAVKGWNSNIDIPSTARNTMVNPNLDAGLPVLFAITGSSGGHAVVGDGYGYQSGTMYHHLNMGWGGNSDTWYNLPNIDSSTPFTSVRGVVYNIYTSGTGEIVSGRILDCAGAPASGVTITASPGGISTSTNSNGIYALKGLSSNTSYTIAATKNGFTFTPQSVTTGTSSDGNSTPGNKWGVDFANSPCSSSTLNTTKTGSGTVTSSPIGITCGATCSTSFASPSTITLTAVANPGSAFIGWVGGGCSGNGACTVNLVANSTVNAVFVPVSVVLSEPFTSSPISRGWTVQDTLGGVGRNWAFSSPCYSNLTGGSGNFAIAEASCISGLSNVDSSLFSPNYDLSQYSGVTLSFKTNFKYVENSTGDVDVSNDGGNSWSNVWRKGSGTNNSIYGPATEFIDITSLAAGKVNVKIRFRYYASNLGGWYWEVDDFVLSGTVVTIPTAPTNPYAKAGNLGAQIYFTPPAEAVLSYTYTALYNASQTAPSSSLPITVTGLTNGNSYAFSVKATNASGITGPVSSASSGTIPGVVVNSSDDETGYQLLQDAYIANSSSPQILIASGLTTVGPLEKASGSELTIIGGFGPTFSTITGTSVIGKLTLKAGKTIVQNIKIQ